ncbi:hypothetical protein [Novilysobacter antarcticus]|uniref:hypothetical protein n=1 Tax=Novilysobacter antarcticus TaxID=2862543 RepID=UPI001C9909E2|nr:hypothetical protein [Lysobacter antarcticus]
MHTQSKQPYQWWRWPLMPLAAIAGSVLGTIVMGILMWLGMKLSGGYSEDGWYFRYIMPVITSGIFGYLYATISYTVAPSGKRIAGIIMVTALGIFSGLSAILGWVMPSYSTGQAIQATVASIATMIGAVMALADPD